MARYKCSGCGYEKEVPAELVGKRVKCPKCQHANQIVAAPQPAGQRPAAAPAPKPTIKFFCPLCDQKLGVPVEYAGKRVRCNKCKNPVDVPTTSQTDIPPAAAAPQHTPAPSPRPRPAPTPAPAAEPDEAGMGFGGFGGVGDLLNMEKETAAAQRPEQAAPTQPQTDPADDAASELMKMQARAGGRKEKQPKAAASRGSGLAVVAAIVGAVCSLVVLAGIAIYLVTPPPAKDYASAEKWVRNYMGVDRGNQEESPQEESAVGEANAPESADSELTPAERPSLKRQKSRHEPAPVGEYGPELAAILADESQKLMEYMDRHKEDASAGAIERLCPMTSAMSDFMGVMYGEPSFTIVRKAQYYMDDSREFGYSLTYQPLRAGDKTQTLVFILESKGDSFVIQGIRAKSTIKGWVEALPPRAMKIDGKTDCLDYARRLAAMPKAYWYAGLPAMAVLAIILIVSLYKVFERSGHLGTSVIVPVYNIWVLAEVGGRPGWLSLPFTAAFILAPMFGGTTLYGGAAVCAVIMLVISLGVASESSKSILWGIGAWLLPGAVYPLLAAQDE
jgi:hypothetical protein